MQGLNWCLNRNVQPNKISPELIYEANTEPPPAKAGGINRNSWNSSFLNERLRRTFDFPCPSGRRRVWTNWWKVNLSLDKGIVEAIDDAAQVRGLSRSAFMAEAAQNEIQGR